MAAASTVGQMTSVGSELDAARALVVERGLTAEAVSQLADVMRGLSLEALAPVKRLVKRFFSAQPWMHEDDEALADAVGAGRGGGRSELDPGITLVWGYDEGRFRLRIERGDVPVPAAPAADVTIASDLSETFDGPVFPEATPSPRTVRFTTRHLHTGPSRSYDSTTATDDPRVTHLLDEFPDITSVLVGPDFVAVTISHADRWEALLAPMLGAVTEQFGGVPTDEQHAGGPRTARGSRGESRAEGGHEPSRLERAWTELGTLRANRPHDLDRILAASRDTEPARRQVAAALLAGAPFGTAAAAWERLASDPSRMVRRCVVDAVADAGREELRSLLERALDDVDAWARWKALRGIVALGVAPSHAAIAAHANDDDFRVRLETARALAADAG